MASVQGLNVFFDVSNCKMMNKYVVTADNIYSRMKLNSITKTGFYRTKTYRERKRPINVEQTTGNDGSSMLDLLSKD